MTLPPITAQILDIPPDITQLGQVVIIAAALLGVVYAIRPLISGFVGSYKELASVNRELLTALRSSDRAHDRAADEIKALRQDATANQDEARMTAKAQSEALSMLVKSQAEIMDQFAKQGAVIAAHDTMAQDAIKRIETAIAALREEISAGHKAQRNDVLGKLDLILAELASLKPPPPPPPKLVAPLHPLDSKKEDAA